MSFCGTLDEGKRSQCQLSVYSEHNKTEVLCQIKPAFQKEYMLYNVDKKCL